MSDNRATTRTIVNQIWSWKCDQNNSYTLKIQNR